VTSGRRLSARHPRDVQSSKIRIMIATSVAKTAVTAPPDETAWLSLRLPISDLAGHRGRDETGGALRDTD
jgi:hypothetical protein